MTKKCCAQCEGTIQHKSEKRLSSKFKHTQVAERIMNLLFSGWALEEVEGVKRILREEYNG